MAKTLGHCEQCGQVFEHARISGRKEGFRVLNREKFSTRIRCTGCGWETLLTDT